MRTKHIRGGNASQLIPNGVGLRTGHIGTLPTATVALRGQEMRVEGAAGTADRKVVCEKNFDNEYVWTDLTLGHGGPLRITAGDNVQAAITYGEANGYKEYVFGPGVFGHDGLIFTESAIVRGAGMFDTQLILRNTVGSTVDNIHVGPTASGNINAFTISDLRLAPQVTAAGRHGVNFDITGGSRSMGHILLDRVNIEGHVDWAVNLTAGTASSPFANPTIATSRISDCQINGGINLTAAADSWHIMHTAIAGENGVVVDLINGAAGFVMAFCNVSAEGGVLIDAAHNPLFFGNYFEFVPGDTASSPNTALIDLRGSTQEITKPVFTHNTINASNDSSAIGVYVGNCKEAWGDANTHNSNSGSYDVEIGASATDTHLGPQNYRYGSPTGAILVSDSGTRTYAQGRQLTGTATWDIPNTVSGGTGATTVTVTGAAVGDPVFVGIDSLSTNSWGIDAHVQAADTVRVTVTNKSGGTLDPGSGTVRAVVFKF